jgi:hypothetical protein
MIKTIKLNNFFIFYLKNMLIKQLLFYFIYLISKCDKKNNKIK